MTFIPRQGLKPNKATAGLPVLPDTYVVGAPKAGTTSLTAWLAEHPGAFCSTPKEPYFWASDYPMLAAHYGFATLAAYTHLFESAKSRAATVRAEGSTVYLYSKTAVPDILLAAPAARFVVCLRNPVDLLASYHRTEVVTLNEPETDFRRAWRLRAAGSLDGADPIDPKLLDYPLVGRLGAALERMLRLVPREQVHVVVFDDLVNSPDGVWRDLTEFLGLAPDERTDYAPRNPSDTMYRSRTLRKVLHRPPASVEMPIRKLRQWSRETDNGAIARLKQATWRPEPKPDVPADLRQELAGYFADDVQLLGRLIGRDLQTHWSYQGF
jgi:Sulfotransferase family